MKKALCGICSVSLILVIIGGLNWGLVGFFDYNLVDSLFGAGSTVSKVIYALVGLAALVEIIRSTKGCAKCEKM